MNHDDRIANCPNCGAPKHGFECEYCGTRFGGDDGYTVLRDWAGQEVLRIKEPN